MAINPAYLKCAVCRAPNSSPFDFHQTAAQQAELAALRADRVQKAARGWTGAQFISHGTRALLCRAHHDRADQLGLSDVPIQEALAQLRAE